MICTEARGTSDWSAPSDKPYQAPALPLGITPAHPDSQCPHNPARNRRRPAPSVLKLGTEQHERAGLIPDLDDPVLRGTRRASAPVTPHGRRPVRAPHHFSAVWHSSQRHSLRKPEYLDEDELTVLRSHLNSEIPMIMILSAFLALSAAVPSTRHVAQGCLRNHSEMPAFILNVRSNILRKPARSWHGLEFTPADTSTVRPVENDSLCDLARVALQTYLPTTMMPPEFLLVTAGKYYVAEWAPKGPTRSEFRPQYFFDSTLKKVLFPCKNGFADC